jgi:polysaccharide export outer membrane protein
MFKLISLTAALFMLLGCAGSSDYQLVQTETVQESQNVSNRSIEYHILPQDRLEVALYKDPAQGAQSYSSSNELGQSMNEQGILVNTKGYISLPLVGKVKVSGLSQTQAADRITAKYKQDLNSGILKFKIHL